MIAIIFPLIFQDQTKKITNSNCYKEVVSAITDDEHYGIKKDILTEIEDNENIIIVNK